MEKNIIFLIIVITTLIQINHASENEENHENNDVVAFTIGKEETNSQKVVSTMPTGEIISSEKVSITDENLNNYFFENSKIKGYSDHTIGTSACIYAVSKGAEYIEKHFSCNKSLNVETQLAHTCSMDYEDLLEIRRNVDSITLIKSKE